MGEDGKPKAEFGVVAKAEIKSEIPSDSAGRTLDALTDIIRPLSEGLGFLGDKIRVHREKTLLEVAKRAKERISLSGEAARPVQAKFLVPLLEKASLEDVNETRLIDMWANLLATCATDEVELLGQYVNMLAEMTSAQARILDDVFQIEEGEEINAGHFVDQYYYYNVTGLPGSIGKFHAVTDPEELADNIMTEIAFRGIAVDTLNIFADDEVDDRDLSFSPLDIYSDQKFYDFENLCRLGVLERVEVKQFRIGRFSIDLSYYIITAVGADLYACCNPEKVVRERKVLEAASTEAANSESAAQDGKD